MKILDTNSYCDFGVLNDFMSKTVNASCALLEKKRMNFLSANYDKKMNCGIPPFMVKTDLFNFTFSNFNVLFSIFKLPPLGVPR